MTWVPEASRGVRPRVSVCIPSHDRRDLLLRALDALARQTIDPGDLEVVVADDGSTDGTSDAVRRAASEGRWPQAVRVVALPHGGPAIARNAAVATARAPVLAFADSDVVPDPEWLAAGLERLSSGDRVGGVEGRTIVREAGRITPFTHQTWSEGGRYPTCNLFMRRDVFEAMGGFDPRFGDCFREDSDLAFRLLDAGWTLPFEKRAVVDHPPLVGGFATPLRLARRYRHDPLLRLKHPRRFARDLDVHVILGLKMARPRQRLYATNVLCALAGAVLASIGSPAWVAAAAWIAYATTYGLVLAAHRPHRAASVVELLAIVPIAAAVPFVYALSYLQGWWAAHARRVTT